MTTDEIKSRIRGFIARFFQNIKVEDDQDIFALGFVNSLFAMQLVLFVEKEFSFTVADNALDIENFRTINTIVHLIEHKTVLQIDA